MALDTDQVAKLRGRVASTDVRLLALLRRTSVPALRISLGVVFVWFGVLKVLDVSPVSELVARTVYWFDPNLVVPALGIFEILVGGLLVLNRWLRLALALFAAQMVGTFLVFIVLPQVAFRDGNPLLLTVEGEFVLKNLVLLTAGMVVGSQLPALASSDRKTPS